MIMKILLPPKRNGERQEITAGNRQITIIGANGSGKTRFTDYLIKELSWYTKLQQILKTSGSIRECSDAVLHLYECPADQSERIELIRYNYAVEIYDRNSKKDPEPEVFYTWQLNAYKILENAYEFIKTVPGGFIAKKSNGYYVTCLGAFGTEKEASEHKDAAKRFNKKAFIITLTKEDILT